MVGFAILIIIYSSKQAASKHFDLGLKNPCVGLSELHADRQSKFVLSEEMITAVKETCNREQQRLISFVSETGCRTGEAISLTCTDVKDDYVVLYTRKSRNSAKTPRFVPEPLCIDEGSEKVFSFTAYPRFLGEKVRGMKAPK